MSRDAKQLLAQLKSQNLATAGHTAERFAELMAAVPDAPGAARLPAILPALRRPSHFPRPVPYQRVTDPTGRRSHRHMLVGSGVIHPDHRAYFTHGEQAAYVVVLNEIRRRGRCKITLKEIGDRAKVTRNVVKRMIRKAVGERLLVKEIRPQRGAKHLPNVLSLDTSSEAGRKQFARLNVIQPPKAIGDLAGPVPKDSGRKKEAIQPTAAAAPERRECELSPRGLDP